LLKVNISNHKYNYKFKSVEILLRKAYLFIKFIIFFIIYLPFNIKLLKAILSYPLYNQVYRYKIIYILIVGNLILNAKSYKYTNYKADIKLLYKRLNASYFLLCNKNYLLIIGNNYSSF